MSSADFSVLLTDCLRSVCCPYNKHWDLPG